MDLTSRIQNARNSVARVAAPLALGASLLLGGCDALSPDADVPTNGQVDWVIELSPRDRAYENIQLEVDQLAVDFVGDFRQIPVLNGLPDQDAVYVVPPHVVAPGSFAPGSEFEQALFSANEAINTKFTLPQWNLAAANPPSSVVSWLRQDLNSPFIDLVAIAPGVDAIQNVGFAEYSVSLDAPQHADTLLNYSGVPLLGEQLRIPCPDPNQAPPSLTLDVLIPIKFTGLHIEAEPSNYILSDGWTITDHSDRIANLITGEPSTGYEASNPDLTVQINSVRSAQGVFGGVQWTTMMAQNADQSAAGHFVVQAMPEGSSLEYGVHTPEGFIANPERATHLEVYFVAESGAQLPSRVRWNGFGRLYDVPAFHADELLISSQDVNDDGIVDYVGRPPHATVVPLPATVEQAPLAYRDELVRQIPGQKTFHATIKDKL